MTRNTGPIIDEQEYGYEIVVRRKRTMYDAARQMERDAVKKKAAELAKAKSDESCDGS